MFGGTCLKKSIAVEVRRERPFIRTTAFGMAPEHRTHAWLPIMIRVCPKCGAENQAASIHCRNCSVKLSEPTVGVMGPPPSLKRRSFLRSAFWVLVLLVVGVSGFWVSENVAWRDVQSGTGGFWARSQVGLQHVQLGASSALYRWFSKWLPGLEVEPAPAPTRAQVSASSPAAALAPTSAPVLANKIKIRCRRCDGLGFTILTEQKTFVDLTGRKHTRTGTIKVPCMLCDQKGGRVIILPAGAEICPACYGMGQTVGKFNNRESILQCNICLGKGYVIRKY